MNQLGESIHDSAAAGDGHKLETWKQYAARIMSWCCVHLPSSSSWVQYWRIAKRLDGSAGRERDEEPHLPKAASTRSCLGAHLGWPSTLA